MYLRQVLVARHGAVVDTVQVAPVVLEGQVLGLDVVLGQGGFDGFAIDELEAAPGFLLFGPNFRHMALGSDGAGEDGEQCEFHGDGVVWEGR